jgi:hypothetical protein
LQLEQLLKKLRGKDYRSAYRAIPRLRKLDDGSLAAIVASYIAALDERDDKVRGYAVICVKAALEFDKTAGWFTPERRARITQALVRAMARHEERPLGLFWLEKYVELLGLTGGASVLERLRAFAGASRRTTMEKLDPDNMPFPYPKDPKDWPPDLPKPVYRVWDVGTGLLEIKILETALKRIRARSS